jgi:acyl-lipid omega-6 desaturase (Delta-12 desaturase)
VNAEELRRELAKFQSASNVRAALELTVTIVPLLCSWALTFSFARYIPLLLIVQIPITAGLTVRAFMILHDCGHHAFFRSRALNNIVGRTMGILTMTPFEYWRRSHALHHASSGSIERRGLGDVPTLMVSEYRALNSSERSGYRLLRHPIILFGIAPFYALYIQTRIPVGLMHQGWKPWFSTMSTNLVVSVIIIILVLYLGFWVVFCSIVPVFALAASSIVWLNFIQHSFKGSRYWPDSEWCFSDAALQASSNYILPQPFRWLSADFGIHHVHHLNSRIPFYRLAEVIDVYPFLGETNRVSGFHDFCISRTLWDEARHKFVTPEEAVFTENW